MAKKKSKSSKISTWLNTGPKKLLAFVLVFVIVGGGFAVYKSFAAENRYYETGTITYYDTGPSDEDAATHVGDGKLTFNRVKSGDKTGGAWLTIKKGNKKTIVHVTDTCNRGTCEDLDVSPKAFKDLGFTTKEGTGEVRFYCNGTGNTPTKDFVPINKCLTGNSRSK